MMRPWKALALMMIKCLVLLAGSASVAHAANYPISAGASTAAIQSTINTAAAASGGNTVTFAAGPYSVTSQINIPCPASPLTIQGPTPAGLGTTWPITPTAILTSALTNNWAFSGTACSVGTTIRYLQFNGGLPSGGGGGFLSIPPGMNNLTVIYNWFYGNNATQQSTRATDMFIYLNGSLGGSPNQNVTIQWNRFGQAGGKECGGNGSDGNPAGSNGGLMDLYGDGTANPGHCSSSGYAPPGGTADCLYQNASDITHGGGSCGAIGIQNNFSNLIIKNNSITDQEQGLKFYECAGSGCSWHSSGLLVQYNDIAGIHRIGAETQFNDVNSGTFFTYDSNDYRDPIKPNAGTWGLSLPQGTTNSTNNVLIANITSSNDKNGQPGFYAGNAIEFWGTGTSSNNLIQGFWHGGIGYGFGGAPRSINNNTIQGGSMGSDFIFNEEGTTPAPAQTGNVTGTTVTAVTSIAPTFSPSPGGYASPLTVTLTDPGYTSGPVPRGNTSIWYTTDGSAPSPGGGTSQLYTVPIIVSLPATIKAIGMWGSLNQPRSYPSGYGFVASAVQTAAYTSIGGVVLSSVSIAPTAGVTALLVGGTVQMIVTCHYSDGSTSGCNTTDSHGNSVTNWASSNGNVTVSSSGLATGAAIGTADISATVTGGFTTSPAATLTVSAPSLTLSSVSIATAGGVSSMNAGATIQLITTCHYSDGSTTTCTTTDSHGNAVSSYHSSAPTIATVTTGGTVTGVAAGSTNLTASVTPAPSMLGTNLENVSGATGNGFINEIYGVTGTSPGSYTTGNCHIILPATTWVAGKLWTCLLVLGTPTTQSASALCSNSYTTTGTSWPGGDLVISMASCPALPANQGYWVGSTTNQTTASPAQGFSNCGGSCSGAPPTFGSGTYAYRYVANPFGNYTSLPATLTPSAGTLQVSQYIELTTTPITSANLPLSITTPPPSLVSAYLTAGSGSMTVGGTMQMGARCHYTSGPDQDCTVADIYGDAVSAWTSSDTTKATVNDVGATHPGLVTAVAPGTPSITATIGTGPTSSAYPITINNPPVNLTGVSLSLTGGVTGLFVGATNHLKATCTYSDGSSDDCTTTDVHGSLAHNYASTTPAHATVNATSGLVTGVAPGATTFTAVAGSFTSNALPLNVFPVLSGVYTITVSGPVKFSGTVRF
jgi:hypothetical protein